MQHFLFEDVVAENFADNFNEDHNAQDLTSEDSEEEARLTQEMEPPNNPSPDGDPQQPDTDTDNHTDNSEDGMGVKDLAREWYLLQLGRVCSNEVSSDHWDFAWKHCDVISELKRNMNGKFKQFPELRKKVLKECAPRLKMDYIFKDKRLPDDSEDYTYVFNRDSFPRTEYSFDKYQLIAQITHIEVKTISGYKK